MKTNTHCMIEKSKSPSNLAKVKISPWLIKKGRAFDNIEKKELFLHRHRFSGNYIYADLTRRLEKKFKIDRSSTTLKRMPNYRTVGWIKHMGFDLTIFLEPIQINMPKCIIEVSGPTHGYLLCLNELLSDLKTSFVEYTMDLYCPDLNSVQNLFDVLIRYCYVPYAGEPYIFSGHKSPYQRPSGLNRTCYFLNLKIYERGPDDKRFEKGWKRKHLDRVRVKFEASRSYLKGRGIEKLEDLIIDCKFSEIMPKNYHFKVFDGSDILPNEIDTYTFIEGHESIQKEYVDARSNGVRNPYQYMKDALVLRKLKRELDQLAIRFDEDWWNRFKT